MSVTAIIALVSVASISLTICYLDARFNLQFIAWMNGKVSNPFVQAQFSHANSAMQEKNQKIKDLEERIQVLEAIVTEPAYELNQKLNRL